MKRLPLAALAVAGIVTALPAAAQFAEARRRDQVPQGGDDAARLPPSDAWRHGQRPRALRRQGRGREHRDRRDAQRLQFTAFVEGSDKGDTRAKPEIWTQKDKLAADVAKSQEDVAKLVAAGKTGNLDQIKAAVGAVGQSCKACHDEFRKD